MPDDDLTPEEREAMEALPREREPSRILEERVVSELRREGLLPRRRGAGARPSGGWWAAAAAAAVALFTGGVALGQTLSARSTAEALVALRDADARATAMLVQQTGSAYVAALAALADRRGSGALEPGDAEQGGEVALAALRAAAGELARLDPESGLARQVVLLLEEPADERAGERRQLIWF
jgi:hypothetical protein